MHYESKTALNIDDVFVLETRILPTAKRWVMDYPAGDTLHESGLRTLNYWGVKDPELRRRMAEIARDSDGGAW